MAAPAPDLSATASKGQSMSSRDFKRLASFIYERLGIQLPAAKQIMLEGRLRKRIRVLGLNGFTEYCDLVIDAPPDHPELVHMTSAVTTNKTDFFREPNHFDVLVGTVLPELLGKRTSVDRPFRIWSAGCSTGEEPYTLAMVLSEASEKRPFRFEVLASDVSMRVLEEALRATYDERRVEGIPKALRSKYLMRSRDPKSELYRIIPELRRLIRFRSVNFLEPDYPVHEVQDVIFCRNVFIYFDRPTQEAILRRFCKTLAPGGYIFLGHSETINGLNVPLEAIAPTVYRYG
jgi:chemotaxis protein methyltransferase CheR